jgi:hypothetical protein
MCINIIFYSRPILEMTFFNVMYFHQQVIGVLCLYTPFMCISFLSLEYNYTNNCETICTVVNDAGKLMPN